MSPGTILGTAPLGRAQHHQGDSQSTLEMQFSRVSKEADKLTPVPSELLIFHVCWAPAYGPQVSSCHHLRPSSYWLPGHFLSPEGLDAVVCWTVFFELLNFLGGGPERGWDAEMAPELQAEASSPSSPGRFVRHCW